MKTKKIKDFRGFENKIFKQIVYLMIFLLLVTIVYAIPNDLNLNLQTITDSGSVTSGTFLFNFSISEVSDCSSFIYSKQASLTTDSRGILNVTLNNVYQDFSKDYYLCYYRGGTLKSTIKMAKVGYAHRTNISDNLNINGTYTIANLNVTGNMSATNLIVTTFNASMINVSEIYINGSDISYWFPTKTFLYDLGYYFSEENISSLGFNTTTDLDSRYLLLNASNDPITQNLTVDILGEDAEFWLESGGNDDACIRLREEGDYGFDICNDGSGLNMLVIQDYLGNIFMTINRDNGTINFYNDTVYNGEVNFTETISADMIRANALNVSYIYNPHMNGSMDIRADPWWLSVGLQIAWHLVVGGNVTVTGTNNIIPLGWGNLTGIPSDIADGDDTGAGILNNTDAQLSDLNVTGTLNVSGNTYLDSNLHFEEGFVNISIIDTDIGALKIVEGENEYMTFDTTDGSEDIEIHKDFKMSGIGLQDYLQTVTGTSLTWQGLDSAVISAYSYFAGDGDGTDSVTLNIFGVGTPDSVANREQLRIGYFPTGNKFLIYTEEQGTGILRNLSIYTEGHADQLLLMTDGNVSFANSVGIGTTSPTSGFTLDVRGGILASGESNISLGWGNLSGVPDMGIYNNTVAQLSDLNVTGTLNLTGDFNLNDRVNITTSDGNISTTGLLVGGFVFWIDDGGNLIIG